MNKHFIILLLLLCTNALVKSQTLTISGNVYSHPGWYTDGDTIKINQNYVQAKLWLDGTVLHWDYETNPPVPNQWGSQGFWLENRSTSTTTVYHNYHVFGPVSYLHFNGSTDLGTQNAELWGFADGAYDEELWGDIGLTYTYNLTGSTSG